MSPGSALGLYVPSGQAAYNNIIENKKEVQKNLKIEWNKKNDAVL